MVALLSPTSSFRMARYRLLALVALNYLRLSHALPSSYTRRDGVAAAGSINDCPGYTASNIVTTDSSLTADLTLAGPACNVYGADIKDLKLLVEYQTGMSWLKRT
jgi:alpha-glucosidase